MSKQNERPDYANLESRRSVHSRRNMSTGRRLGYFLALPLLRLALLLFCSTYRVVKIIGRDHAERIIADQDRIYAPCYWHQHHVLCSNLMRQWLKKGFRACFLISASVDGEVPDRIVRSWGAQVIRGSANQTGALVLRDMQRMMQRGVSIVTTADGPNGPRYTFKMGAVLMARIGGAPLVPLACASDRAWYLKRWDRFMIPKPFARVVYAIGAPIDVPRDTPLDQLEPYRLQIQDAINALTSEAKSLLQRRPDV